MTIDYLGDANSNFLDAHYIGWNEPEAQVVLDARDEGATAGIGVCFRALADFSSELSITGDVAVEILVRVQDGHADVVRLVEDAPPRLWRFSSDADLERGIRALTSRALHLQSAALAA